MRDVLEDALVMYRQEAESLLLVSGPAIIAGPILVLVSAAGLRPALITIPLLVLLYLAVYAAAISAAELMRRSADPEPGASYATALRNTPDSLLAAAPGAFLVGALWATAVGTSHLGVAYAGAGLGALAALSACVWAARHAFDLPLIVSRNLSAGDAGAISAELVERQPGRTLPFFAAVVAPLAATALVSLALAMVAKPAFGGVVFAAAFALWLPFAALALSLACERFVDEILASDPAPEPTATQ